MTTTPTNTDTHPDQGVRVGRIRQTTPNIQSIPTGEIPARRNTQNIEYWVERTTNELMNEDEIIIREDGAEIVPEDTPSLPLPIQTILRQDGEVVREDPVSSANATIKINHLRLIFDELKNCRPGFITEKPVSEQLYHERAWLECWAFMTEYLVCKLSERSRLSVPDRERIRAGLTPELLTQMGHTDYNWATRYAMFKDCRDLSEIVDTPLALFTNNNNPNHE
jgi:hypothetical protein